MLASLCWTVLLAVCAPHDPPQASARLDAEVAAKPNDPAVYFARGSLLLQLRRADAALRDFDRGLALRADWPGGRVARGHALAALGRHADVLATIEREAADAAVLVLRARALAGLRRHGEALAAWDRALCAARLPEFYLERADCGLAADDLPSALASIDAGVAALGPLVSLVERGVALCEHAGRFEAALARLDQLLPTLPHPARWLVWRARLLERLGRAADAAASRARAMAALERLPLARANTPAMRALRAQLGAGVDTVPIVVTAAAPDDAVAAAAASPPVPASVGTTLLPRGSYWRYLDDGSDPGRGWSKPEFDDATWLFGRGELGYGDGDEMWPVGFGGPPDAKAVTTYFRTVFTVTNPAQFALAHVDLRRDDGAVVYLNGREIARSNLPAGPIATDTLALFTVGGQDERTFNSFTFPVSLLQPGLNWLAVEVHQADRSSSDISFDLELVATPALSISRGPYLQTVTSNSAVVRWRTDVPTPTSLWTGAAANALTLWFADNVAKTEHEVVVTGLTPASRTFYAVGTGTQQLAGGDADHVIRTAAPPGTAAPTRLWVLGDSGTASTAQFAVRDAFLAFNGTRALDGVLMLGDNAYQIGTDAEFQRGLFDVYPTVLRNTCLWPTVGNHDAYSARSATQAGAYFDAFTLPSLGQAGGLASGTEAYYSFDIGRVHCICLDSQDSARTASGAMMTWLAADLASTTADWVIAFFHHPPYSKGSHDSDNPIGSEGRMKDMREIALPILEAGGVDLVLTGHSHSYERSYLLDGHYDVSTTLTPQMLRDRGDGRERGDGAYHKASRRAAHEGAVYVVAGSSGSVAFGLFGHPAHVISLAVLGSLVLDIDGTRLLARFVDDAGNVRDEFTVEKGTPRWLRRDEPTIAVSTGGTQSWQLDAGAAHAGRNYVLAGSFGTSPGFVRSGVTVPLNPDSWFATTLQFANSALLRNTVGQLDSAGRATASIVLPPLPSSLAGIELHHAFVVLDAGRVSGASNPVKLRLVQ